MIKKINSSQINSASLMEDTLLSFVFQNLVHGSLLDITRPETATTINGS